MVNFGDGTQDAKTTFGQVQISSNTYLTNVVQIAVGEQFGIALKSDGTVWTWGVNESGQLRR